MRYTVFSLALAALSDARATPKARATNPPYFILTGDSTVAVSGGWGDGFQSFVADPANGTNLGVSGATTASYRAASDWEGAIEEVENNSDSYEPIVTIQFGHNDQKGSSGVTIDEYQANLEDMANEVSEAGGTPIIVTSLTRRSFEDGAVVENLSEQRERAIAAAEATDTTYLDLNQASTDYINAIGEEDAQTYDHTDGDSTHLNDAGEVVFGRMVADLMIEARDDLTDYFEPNEELSDKISSGEYATGDE